MRYNQDKIPEIPASVRSFDPKRTLHNGDFYRKTKHTSNIMGTRDKPSTSSDIWQAFYYGLEYLVILENVKTNADGPVVLASPYELFPVL